MSVIPLEYYAPVFGLFLLLLLVVFVPRERYKELFWFGLVWGFLFSTAVTFLFPRSSIYFIMKRSSLLSCLVHRSG